MRASSDVGLLLPRLASLVFDIYSNDSEDTDMTQIYSARKIILACRKRNIELQLSFAVDTQDEAIVNAHDRQYRDAEFQSCATQGLRIRINDVDLAPTLRIMFWRHGSSGSSYSKWSPLVKFHLAICAYSS